ncbi:MAG: hypothetical protein KAG96_07990, partial [Ichthyobacteriaceae bacterium]|nr:hypothetical protein [Ichthyobacteriaceae bacterium]
MNTKFTTLLLLFTLWVGGLFAQPKYSTYLDGTKTVTGLLTGGAKETNHGMTVEFWFNADEVDTKQLIYYPGDTNGGHLKDGVNFWIEGGYICMGIYYYGNKDIGNKSFEGAWFREEIQKSTWYHVALVLNSEADKMFWYLNGTYKNELDVKFAKQLFGKKFTEKLTVLPTEWSENSSYIFSKNSIPGDKIETVNSDLGGISFFKGYIGLFRKWNSARTISQINDNKLEFIKKDTYTEPEYFVSYLRTTFVWDGNEDSTWENGNNWLGGSVPQAGSNVYIEVENTERTNNAVKPITGNETFNFNLFTVSPKSTLRLSNTAILNVTGVFTIKSDATGTGSLITNGGVVNAGTFNIERHIAYTGMGTFSSPVVDANMGMFLNKTYKVYKHQEYLRQYGSPYSLVTGTSEVINKVEGYFVDYNSLISDSKITYTGVPTTGNTSFILSSTKYNEENNMHYGWNLIGNPYPSAIDLDKVFAVNNIDSIGATVYYFNGATDSWLVYNRTQPSVNSAYKIVPIGQAFFIQLKGGNADYTFTLNNSMRVESNDNINFGDSSSSAKKSAKKSVGKKELIVYPENSFTLKSTMNNNTD